MLALFTAVGDFLFSLMCSNRVCQCGEYKCTDWLVLIKKLSKAISLFKEQQDGKARLLFPMNSCGSYSLCKVANFLK